MTAGVGSEPDPTVERAPEPERGAAAGLSRMAWLRWLSPLSLRIVSGLVLGLLVLGLLVVGRTAGTWAIVVLLGGLALWEFRGLSAHMGYKAASWLVYPLGLYFAFSGTVLKSVPVSLVLSGALLIGLSAFLFLPTRRGGLGRWAMGMAGALYVGLPLNYYLLLFSTPAWPRGLLWVIVVIVAVIASDVGAYAAGHFFGRHPFFPQVSPNKTVEGAVAAVGASVLVMTVGGWAALDLPIGHGLALGALVGVFAVLGDLVESQMKRLAGVKDSSGLVPGHGGVLDRLDSLLFPPVVAFFYASYLHLL